MSVCDAVVIDAGSEPAGAHEGGAIEAGTPRRLQQFVRRLARVPAAAAADVQSEFGGTGIQTTLERSEHGGRDPRGVPVHPHDASESLKPVRIAQPRKQFGMAVVE